MTENKIFKVGGIVVGSVLGAVLVLVVVGNILGAVMGSENEPAAAASTTASATPSPTDDPNVPLVEGHASPAQRAEWRRAANEASTVMLPALAARHAGWSNDRTLEWTVDVCSNIFRGSSGGTLLDYVSAKFTGGSAPVVSRDDARVVLDLTRAHVCPELTGA